MAVKITGEEEMLAKLEQLKYGATKNARAGVKAGAEVFINALKANTPIYDGADPVKGPRMVDHLIVGSISMKSGFPEAQVGYDKVVGQRVHFPNAGTSEQSAQHFIEKTQAETRTAVIEAMVSHLKLGD